MIIDSFFTPHINSHDLIINVGLVSSFFNTIQVSTTRISQILLPIGYVYVIVFFLFLIPLMSTYHVRTFIPGENCSISIECY